MGKHQRRMRSKRMKKERTKLVRIPALPRRKKQRIRHTPDPEACQKWPDEYMQGLWGMMMDGQRPLTLAEMKSGMRKRYFQAFATLTRDVVATVWHGHDAEPQSTTRLILARTRVRIVMASRFGDVGITDDLEAPGGYCARVMVVDDENPFSCSAFEDIEWFEYKGSE